ncbi:MAG: Gfo/Idh/MocA family oxidoreductase, partial [Gammaproteobacteria bacterium]|nr:Gfo/Idh/MocA family oxidoreductase [Gammaproteobacteria bacterium]
MGKIRTAVVGVGYLGHYHAEKYAKLANSELTALCDINSKRLQDFAKKLGVAAYDDYQQLIGKVDAVS